MASRMAPNATYHAKMALIMPSRHRKRGCWHGEINVKTVTDRLQPETRRTRHVAVTDGVPCRL